MIVGGVSGSFVGGVVLSRKVNEENEMKRMKLDVFIRLSSCFFPMVNGVIHTYMLSKSSYGRSSAWSFTRSSFSLHRTIFQRPKRSFRLTNPFPQPLPAQSDSRVHRSPFQKVIHDNHILLSLQSLKSILFDPP